MALVLSSPAFQSRGPIPRRHTCEGTDTSPPLQWSGAPPGARHGSNDWGRAGYGGPCPPIGRHRYYHRWYALDAELPDLGRSVKARLPEAMRGHVLAEAELLGTYHKGQKGR